MKSFEYTITDPVGIHARPAGLLVKEIKSYAGSAVTISKGEKSVNALKLMALMQMGIKQGVKACLKESLAPVSRPRISSKEPN